MQGKSKAKKATNRKLRKNEKFPALNPSLNLKTRCEEIEDLASYAHLLTDEDKAWLNSYAEEEICANFNHKGPKLNDKEDAATRSRIYNRNNQRNRCIFTQEKAQGCLESIETLDLDNESGVEEDFD